MLKYFRFSRRGSGDIAASPAANFPIPVAFAVYLDNKGMVDDLVDNGGKPSAQHILQV